MAFHINGTLLEACVLSLLERGDMYGYKLTLDLKEAVDISESTLYPVLRRLQKNELLTTYDIPFQGRNRRYYKIALKGHEQLQLYREEWKHYQSNISYILSPLLFESGKTNEV
ncbi:MAG: PadR family transcriptional regulator [Epulopiscium sp. Nele67-Bin001]|nr:MAG: PadR family transcriptional regulator [Epulopiscium sp. Nuni2H_MBin001]OON90464.1 MAG: PadR family transcriptional regulator [Epulopiscium sp. Nele67-Bin001]